MAALFCKYLYVFKKLMDRFSVLDRYTDTKKFIIIITGESNGNF